MGSPDGIKLVSGNPGYGAPEEIPFIATLAYAFRSSGGKITAINAARLVAKSDPRYATFLHAYDTANETDKKSLTLEELCDASEIPHDEFLGTVTAALWNRNRDIGRLIAVAAHPEIVDATIQAAKGQWGVADRRLLLEQSEFIAPAQGTRINVNTQVNATSNSVAQAKGGESKVSITHSLPSFEDDGKSINHKLREAPLQISAPIEDGLKITIPPVQDAEFVDVPRNDDRAEDGRVGEIIKGGE